MESSNKACSKLTPILTYLNSLSDRADLTMLGELLKQTAIVSQDVQELCTYNDKHYARNKVASGPWFDLFIMCWRPGQCSAIHDHVESSCAFRILEGVATESVCVITDSEKRYVRQVEVQTYQVGEICTAQDESIHQISNASLDQNLVTMHIYSPPLKMSVYEMDPRFWSDDKPLAA